MNWDLRAVLKGLLLPTLCCSLLFAGCGTKKPPAFQPAMVAGGTALTILGYTIQVGAFANLDNANRLSEELIARELDAFFYVEQELYKVRFGNFARLAEAQKAADLLVLEGFIADYYIVPPESHAVSKFQKTESLRAKLIDTAEDFLGLPYKWGGTTAAKGFDCSGLSMVVYKLNGLDLPRTSSLQFKRGRAVARQELKAGDLVFFSTNNSGNVSHVGIYKGEDFFIHAPRRGKTIKISNLNSSYFSKRYLGARSYLF